MAPLRSLKFRIALTVFALECVMMVVALWQTSSTQTEALRAQQQAARTAVLDLASRISRTALLTDELGELHTYFASLQKDPAVERVLLGNAKGVIVASAELRELGQPLPPLVDAAPLEWLSLPIENATGRLGVIAVQFSSRELLKAQAAARRLGFAIAAIGMTLIALVGLALGALLTRRLGQLTEVASRMAEGDRSVRAQLAGDDEVASLGLAFDSMADAVARQEQQLREQRQEIELLLASTAEAIFGIDPGGRCTFANPACARMLGAGGEPGLIGRDMQSLFDLPGRGETPWHRDDVTLRRLDGSSFPAEVWSHPLLRDGRPLGAVVTFVDISERKAAERALVEERNFSSAVLGNAGALIVVLDREGRIRRFNRAAEQLSGRRFADVEGRFPWDTVLPPEKADEIRRNAFDPSLAEAGQDVTHYTNEWMDTGGKRHWIEWTNSLLRDAQGRMAFMVSIGVDISERRAAAEKIRVALHEKELLLKEIYHRVKNNLQMVVSLLTLQARNTEQPQAREALGDSARRIRSMALVHEQLYQSGDLSVINFGSYIRQLVHQIESSYEDDAARIRVQIEAAATRLGIETAVPLGLVVNELVTNAHKHAFPAGRSGTIALRLQELPGGELELSVSDDGVGLPEGIDPAQSRSLGLRLVAMLAAQLDAELALARPEAGGSRFTLRFVPQRPEDQRLPGPQATRSPTTSTA